MLQTVFLVVGLDLLTGVRVFLAYNYRWQLKSKEKGAMECAGDLVKAVLRETEGAEERHLIFPIVTVFKSIFLKG